MGGEPDVGELRRLYVEERWSTGRIGEAVGMSSGTVWKRLTDAGVVMRPRGVEPRLSCVDLRRWYIDERRSTVKIAETTGMSTSGVTAAMARAGIDRRPLGTELDVDDDTLTKLYVEDRLSHDEIAERFEVTPFAVRRRLQDREIHRPGPAPGSDWTTPPPAETLRCRYLDGGETLSQLATAYGVPHPTVRRWLVNAGISLPARHGVQGARPDEPAAMTREVLWDRYVDEELTTDQIAAEFGVTKNMVAVALHAQRIPVRPPGPAGRPGVVLLDALYADPEVTACLDRHHVPHRPEAGWLRDRWPEPAEVTAAALADLYVEVGLSVHHISLLTGLGPAGVRSRLQTARIPARATERTPWTTRTTQNH